MAETAPPGLAVSGSGELSIMLQALRRRPAAVLIGASALVALAALAYSGYQQRSVPDISWPAAMHSETNGRSESADAANNLRRSSGDVAEAPPRPAARRAAPSGVAGDAAWVPPALPERLPQGAVGRAAVAGARAAQADKLAALPANPTVAVSSKSAARAVAADPRSAGRETTGSTEAAAAVAAAMARTATAPAGNAAQPPRIGPCTEAVAALGLCTPDSTQRKQ